MLNCPLCNTRHYIGTKCAQKPMMTWDNDEFEEKKIPISHEDVIENDIKREIEKENGL